MSVRYAKSVKEVVKAVGCANLNLYRGEGYWYFIYDSLDGADANGRYDSESVYTMRLNDMALDLWVDIGKNFVAKVEAMPVGKVLT